MPEEIMKSLQKITGQINKVGTPLFVLSIMTRKDPICSFVTLDSDAWRVMKRAQLRNWRRTSIPEWRRVLKESIKSGNTDREEYARWMLRDILEDSEYVEKHNND